MRESFYPTAEHVNTTLVNCIVLKEHASIYSMTYESKIYCLRTNEQSVYLESRICIHKESVFEVLSPCIR